MSQGFGFNLHGASITMWVGEAESPPLTDLQIDDCIVILREFRELRNRKCQEGLKVKWREDLDAVRVITGYNE